MISQIFILLWLVQLAKLQATSNAGDEVIATLGQPVHLKCDLGKRINPSVIRIYWQGRKPNDTLGEFPEVLHVFNKGVEELDTQTSCYRSRTRINRDLISKGNLSLLISEAKVEDDGTQLIVHLQEKGGIRNLCKQTLRVTAVFQKPEVSVSCMESAGEQKIMCSSHGGFPKPTINWTGLNPQGNNLQATLTISRNGSTYSVHSALWVNITKDQSFTCYVTNPTLQETVNTSITPSAFCPDMPHHHMTGIILGVGLVFVIILGCITGLFSYKKNQCCREARGPTSDPDEEKNLKDLVPGACCET